MYACSEEVPYLGGKYGLFAMTTETVYARTYLDAVISLCVVARRPMSAAAELLTSCVRDASASVELEVGRARPMLSNAIEEFSRTLVIVDSAIACIKCGEEERVCARLKCITDDGQILSVLEEHMVLMLRPGVNVPCADIPPTCACALSRSKHRRVVRNSVRAVAD